MSRLHWMTALALCVMTLPAEAQSGLSLGRPAYGGPGCPAGTASVQVSGGTSLSVRFSRYQVSAGGGSGRTFDRKACSLAIPVRVPSGRSVSILSVTYRGYNALTAGGKSTFRTESFFSGGTGPVFTRSFSGPVRGSFAVEQNAAVRSTVWSACGASVTLRTNSSLLVNSGNGGAVSASVRSQDVSTAILYRLQWRSC